MIVIVVNCGFLAMDKEVEFVTNNSDTIDLVFLIIYTIEMFLKIIAQGFFMRAHSYLRDNWNIVSFALFLTLLFRSTLWLLFWAGCPIFFRQVTFLQSELSESSDLSEPSTPCQE